MAGFIVVCVIVALVLVVLAPNVRKNLALWGRALLGKAGGPVAQAGPQAQLDQRFDQALADISRAKTALEAEKELVISCQRRVDQNTAEATRLTSRLQAEIADGDPHGSSRDHALSLAHVREQLASNTEQLAKHKANYEAYNQKVKAAQQQVSDARQKARELGLDLQESEHEAELAKFAENFSASTDSEPMGDAISKVQEKIDLNKAKAAVANDMNQQSLAEAKQKELEQQAKADAILAEFAKK